jgi:hypothetical protein
MRQILSFLLTVVFLWSCRSPEDSATALQDIDVNPATLNLMVGDKQQIIAGPVPSDANPVEQPFTWRTSDSRIATVTAAGNVTAKSVGSAEITVAAKISDHIQKKIPVKVKSVVPLAGILVSPDTVEIIIGESVQITASPDPPEAGAVFEWTSDNTAVATVSSGTATSVPPGLITGVAAGTTFVTVKYEDIATRIPVTVIQIFTLNINNTVYDADTLGYAELAPGVKWLKFSVPEFTNGFGTLGKGLVVNALEVDISVPGNRIEVCPAAKPSLSGTNYNNVERPTRMYARKTAAYAASGRRPVAVVNSDFYLLSSGNATGYAYIDNRPLSMELTNGMLVQTPFTRNLGFVLKDDGRPAHGTVDFSGTVDGGNRTCPLAEVNGFADKGELVLFNNLGNYYPGDSTFAWSPYASTMVSLSYPEGGWRVNERMEFTVTAIEHNVTTAIPVGNPYGGKDFNGEGAILAGNSYGNPNQPLAFETVDRTPNQMTVNDQGSYWELTTTGSDPYAYTTPLTTNVRNAVTASLTFEYQSAISIANCQVFYGRPDIASGVSTPANLTLTGTGIDAAVESKWRTFTLDLKTAIDAYGWGKSGHTLRLDVGSSANNHVLIRNMKVSVTFSSNDSQAFLSNLTLGDKVGVTMDVKLNGTKLTDTRPNVAGYESVILREGTPTNTWNEAHPRTVAGYSQDGSKVWLVVIDGRLDDFSVGVTTGQAAYILKALGAHIAVNMDGGGSSCMVVEGSITNTPSDGSERAVANGIMVVVSE